MTSESAPNGQGCVRILDAAAEKGPRRTQAVPLKQEIRAAPVGRHLPLPALLVMALMGFILIATETMPAGLLPHIAAGLNIAEGTAGQLVSAYALGTVVLTIPAIALTRGMRRKPVFLVGILGFLLANTIAAFSADIVLTLAVRFAAGAFSGLLWGMLAGYARRITAPELAGRALAIASIGTPLGLALGTPLGSWLGSTFDWRWSFWALTGMAILTAILAWLLVPDAPGQRAESQIPMLKVFAIPGVSVILLVIFAWMLAHNTVYTYIAAYLRSANIPLGVDVALVVFGASALIGIWITGALIDRAPWLLVLVSLSVFLTAGVVFFAGAHSLVAVLIALVLWGVAFGGAAPQLQTAISEASGENADVANSLLGVAFNVAIFAAGVLGAVLITSFDGMVLPLLMIGLAATALIIAFTARRAAFPVHR
ncbi:MFS transporter [Arthrobacter sp. PAMC 25486]|uniref:MFS transporter n=1 Tax=Arthrobacter sp. PAMC 25486 TaxID=1494608 RepID=UPI0020A63E5D|nr:MFS transporter [Arthrobacter sp. PAMC 25486]